MTKNLAIIDDYEHAAAAGADWSCIAGDVAVSIFHEPLGDEDAVAARLADFELVLIMRERTPFPRSLLEKLPKLEHLITSGMRNACIDLDAARERGIVVSGTPILPYPAAEHAWALILALAKRIPAHDGRLRSGGWGGTLNTGLNGKTLGVIGLGKLGSRVARIGLAFEMNVLAWSPNLTAARCADIGVTPATKREVFEAADFVTIHLVLGDRSRGIVGERELDQMKPGAYLVNTSRGPIVDEAALIRALETGAIAGAGLDVFDTEPLPVDHALRRLPNTVLTPHQGYVTRENYSIFYSTALDNIRAWLRGRPVNVLT